MTEYGYAGTLQGYYKNGATPFIFGFVNTDMETMHLEPLPEDVIYMVFYYPEGDRQMTIYDAVPADITYSEIMELTSKTAEESTMDLGYTLQYTTDEYWIEFYWRDFPRENQDADRIIISNLNLTYS